MTNDIIPFNGGAYFSPQGSRGVAASSWGSTGVEPPLGVRAAWRSRTTSTSSTRTISAPSTATSSAGLPATTVTGAASYTLPVGLSVEGRVEHVGRYFADDANTAEAESYVIFGGSVGFERNTPIGDDCGRSSVERT